MLIVNNKKESGSHEWIAKTDQVCVDCDGTEASYTGDYAFVNVCVLKTW